MAMSQHTKTGFPEGRNTENEMAAYEEEPGHKRGVNNSEARLRGHGIRTRETGLDEFVT